ncbi:selenoprotein S-like [Battus philenor]|uniref:selenoprotein S-like n=1 Tax=Battus philenor TaxID=42288 RepID=UPI0035D057A6
MDQGNESAQTTMFNPLSYVLQLLASYGWPLVGVGAVLLYLVHKLRPHYQRWRQDLEDAEYHKDPDKALARMQAIQAAREKQQKLLEEASAKALEEQQEREERRRAEHVAKLQQLLKGDGQRLGSGDDYLPLSGGASTSSYRPPKRSACARGGCGR